MKPGIYIHIPFCIKKCSYCDFYSVTDLSMVDPFVKALCVEMRLASHTYGDLFSQADTVYIGGGTPSVLGVDKIDQILDTARKAFRIADNSEITLEINPGTVQGTALRDLKSAGVNRLSIGVQSLDDEDLVFLGRCHSAAEARATLHDSAALFNNYTIDLIHTIPGQSIERYCSSLQEVIAAGAPHISAYALTIEESTPLHQLCKKGKVTAVVDEDASRFLETTIDVLTGNNYRHYEISNFAFSDAYISRHNSKYWDFTPYVGIGPSAHSFDGVHRWANIANVKTYCEKLKEGLMPLGNEEGLSQEERFVEYIMLGLRRLIQGIDLDHLRSEFPVQWNETRRKKLSSFIDDGYITTQGSCIALTQKGTLLCDMVVRELTL